MVVVANHLAKACQWTLNTVLPKEGESIPIPLDGPLKSIGVVTPHFIGDTLLASVLIQNLAQQLPSQTKIYTITSPYHLNALETLPRVAKHFPLPLPLAEKQELLRKLQCDSVFLLRFSVPWAFSMMKAGVRNRIGFNLERFGVNRMNHWSGLLTHAISSGHFDTPDHQVELYKTMLTQLGLSWDDYIRPKIHLSQQDAERALGLLGNMHQPRVLVHLTAGSPGKQWPLSYWAKLLPKIRTEHHASFFAVGTASDRSIYQELEALSGTLIHNFCGQTTLRESAALCQFSDMVITLDTAIAHIAAAVDAPRLVVIYGPTNYQQWRPIVSQKTHMEQAFLKIACRPCITRSCYHRSCINFLSPERVMAHVNRAFKNQSQYGAGLVIL